MTLDQPIFTGWPAKHRKRPRGFSLPTPNGVKIGPMRAETGLAYEPHPLTF